jgi:hypothetical protein
MADVEGDDPVGVPGGVGPVGEYLGVVDAPTTLWGIELAGPALVMAATPTASALMPATTAGKPPISHEDHEFRLEY